MCCCFPCRHREPIVIFPDEWDAHYRALDRGAWWEPIASGLIYAALFAAFAAPFVFRA